MKSSSQITLPVEAKRGAQEDAIVRNVLRNGPHLDRRKFFVSAGAFAATVSAPAGAALAQGAPTTPPRVILRKPDNRLLNIGATVRSGRYWEFTTWVTPV